MLRPAEVFNIEKQVIRAKFPCSITIDSREYDKRSFIETASKFQLPGILTFYVPQFDDYATIVLNYPVNLNKTDTITIDKKEYISTIHYEKDDIIITQEVVADEVDMGLLIRLLQGHVKYAKDPKIILNMLHDILPKVDLVHLELVISNMFRVNGEEEQRCRLSGDYSNSVIIGVKKQPFLDSWLSSLAFQYIEKAIQTGLVRGKTSERNAIEKVLTEDFKNL